MAALFVKSIQPTRYPIDRIARWILAVLDSTTDIKTVGHWSRYLGVSKSSIRETCTVVAVRPKDALDFARLLRALYLGARAGVPPVEFLDISDLRTHRRLMARAGLTDSSVNVDSFLVSQQLIRCDRLVTTTGDLLRQWRRTP